MPSEEVCEYVEIFYKIEKLPPGATAKNYFKVHSWCSDCITIHLAFHLTLHFHAFSFTEKEAKVVRVINRFYADKLSLGAL